MRAAEHMSFLITATTGLVAIVNPIGAVPVFLGITDGMDTLKRRQAARQATVAVTVILLVTALFGRFILMAFGLSIDAFRAGGGLVILLMGLEMLRGERTRVQEPRPPEADEVLEDSILVPFAMPMVAGPGAITTAMTLSSEAKGPWGHTVLLVSILLVGSLLALALASASRIQRLLGSRGQRIFLRFMGLILVALGAQFTLAGAKAFLLGH